MLPKGLTGCARAEAPALGQAWRRQRSRATVTVCFAPEEDCDAFAVEAIDSAEREILVSAYRLTVGSGVVGAVIPCQGAGGGGPGGAVRFAFFAPGNDPEVWRDGWYPAVARMQTAATKASRVEEWWGAGKARLLVVVGLQDVVAPPENGRLIKDEFGHRVTLQEIDGAGHAMLPERPKQVAAAVLNFLKPQSK